MVELEYPEFTTKFNKNESHDILIHVHGFFRNDYMVIPTNQEVYIPVAIGSYLLTFYNSFDKPLVLIENIKKNIKPFKKGNICPNIFLGELGGHYAYFKIYTINKNKEKQIYKHTYTEYNLYSFLEFLSKGSGKQNVFLLTCNSTEEIPNWIHSHCLGFISDKTANNRNRKSISFQINENFETKVLDMRKYFELMKETKKTDELTRKIVEVSQKHLKTKEKIEELKKEIKNITNKSKKEALEKKIEELEKKDKEFLDERKNKRMERSTREWQQEELEEEIKKISRETKLTDEYYQIERQLQQVDMTKFQSKFLKMFREPTKAEIGRIEKLDKFEEEFNKKDKPNNKYFRFLNELDWDKLKRGDDYQININEIKKAIDQKDDFTNKYTINQMTQFKYMLLSEDDNLLYEKTIENLGEDIFLLEWYKKFRERIEKYKPGSPYMVTMYKKDDFKFSKEDENVIEKKRKEDQDLIEEKNKRMSLRSTQIKEFYEDIINIEYNKIDINSVLPCLIIVLSNYFKNKKDVLKRMKKYKDRLYNDTNTEGLNENYKVTAFIQYITKHFSDDKLLNEALPIISTC